MLLMIGYLTTPTSSTGVSLSEFWAWVRYLAAVTGDDDLRLTSSFANLDAHQKTILSDDFGMGVPMGWLTPKLAFDRICDGRYFMQRLAATMGVTARKTAKRGPNKTPDFVARDTSGIWHVVECKGTQTSYDYSDLQLGHKGPPPWGGVAQKRSLVFPCDYTGQRLVCGLTIGPQSGSFASRLTIIDPEPEDPFKVPRKDLYLAEDAAERSVVSKALRLSGFEAVAETTASPWGRDPSERPYLVSSAEDRRRGRIEQRTDAAREELEALDERDHIDLGGGKFRGRRLTFDLPRAIEVDGRRVVRARIRQGISDDVLREMRQEPNIEDPLADREREWRDRLGATVLEADEFGASMHIGQIFQARIDLE